MRRQIRLLVALSIAIVPALAAGFAQTAHAQPTPGNGMYGSWVPNSTFTVAVNYCGTTPGTISPPPCAANTTQSYTLTTSNTNGGCTTSFTANGTTVGNPAQTWSMTGAIGPYTTTSNSELSFTTTGSGPGADGLVITTDNDNDAATDPEAVADGDEGTVSPDGSATATAYDNFGRVDYFIFPAGSFVVGPNCGLTSTTPTQGSQIGTCNTTYLPTQTAQQMEDETISNCSPVWPGGGINAAGSNSVGIHWTGTEGSYAHFPCAVPSIVTGKEYATYNSSELDVATTSQDGYNNIQEWCQVQLPASEPRPTMNILAYINGNCYNQSQNPPYSSTTYNNQFYVTETPGGLATLHCNFRTYIP